MMEIGCRKEELDTPALLIDLDLMEKNIQRMSHFLNEKNAKLRPHSKVHRTPIIARMQMEAGAIGICCQKVRQAEIMAEAGINDILIPNVIATPNKIKRLAALSKHSNITVIVDDVSNAEQLAHESDRIGTSIGVLVDVQVGDERFGLDPGEPVLNLTKRVTAMRGLKFLGLMCHIGFLSQTEPRTERRTRGKEAEASLIKTKDLLERSGIKVERLSSGTTGTYDVSADNPEITEIRAGSYVLMDSSYHEHVPEFDCAMRVLGTVISKNPKGIVVLDVGMASMSTEHGMPRLARADGLSVYQVHAENLLLKPDNASTVQIGDKVELIPSYLDGTVVRNDKFYGIRDDEVEAVWDIMGRNASY